MSQPSQTTQLIATWIVGSVAMGTVAVLLTDSRGEWPFRPLDLLPSTALFTLFLLLGALFLALTALSWRTDEVSWLPGDLRGAVLWTALVGGCGLVGWGFAAVVTFEVGFSIEAQLVLAYLGGGLPFALVAALLARSMTLNVTAAGLILVALLVGWALMGGNPVQTCVEYLRWLVGPTGATAL